MAFAHFSENISLGFSIFWRKDIHDLGNPRKINIFDYFFQENPIVIMFMAFR